MDSSNNKAASLPKESGKHKRIQSAVTTTGLMSGAADDLAEEVPSKTRAVAQTPEAESSEYDSSLQHKSAAKSSKKSKAIVEDLIQDIYSEDNLENFDSPDKQAEEKLNPVIEESHEYSVTPSRVIHTNTVSPAKETSANKKQ